MIAETTDYLSLLGRMLPGATVGYTNVSWDEYEALLAEMGDDWPGRRVSYYHGKLEIAMPLPEHEEYKDFIFRLANVLAEELEIDLETRGGATWRRRKKVSGVEPDTCFYVQNAAHAIGRREFDLEHDLPPDVAVEIDKTHPSTQKFPIYAGLGVAEIWRYDGRRVTFYELQGGAYQRISHSRAFPVLASHIVTQFLEQSKTDGQSAALRAFRCWLREQS